MSTYLEDYQRKMDEHIKQVYKTAERIVDETLKEMYKRIVDRTPIGDPTSWKYPGTVKKDYVPGKLKASWNLSFNNTGARNALGQFTSISQATNSGSGGIKISVGSADATASISNTQPYAYRVEYGSWSKQAPAGMMRITVSEYAQIVDAQTAKYRIK